MITYANSQRPAPYEAALGSVLVSFISARGRSPMFTRIGFAQFADGGGRW
jgi:hypothetical protein